MNDHSVDCTIYASIHNQLPTDGICTCGYGLKILKKYNNDSKIYSEERSKAMKDYYQHPYEESKQKAEELARNVINQVMNNTKETFDWKQAMRLFADGVEIESCVNDEWSLIARDSVYASFYLRGKYRRKPVKKEPDWSKDQGFQRGDVVMFQDNGDSWRMGFYDRHENGFHFEMKKFAFMKARPLTSEEAKRVRVENSLDEKTNS